MKPSDRSMRALVVAIIVSAAVNLAGSGLFVWYSAEARKENCRNVRDAFDDYTDALAEVSSADEETVDEFRDAYANRLEECR